MKKVLFKKIDCVRIPVENLEEGIDFYSKKLGLKLLWKSDTAVGLQLENDKSEVVLFSGEEDLEIDFKVDNVDQAVKEYVKAGGSIIKEPFDIPIGKCVVVADPWKNIYVLLDSSKGTFVTNENKEVIGLTKEAE
jgi:predicted enzyme related to lactoylglutathione lyase